MRDKTFLIEKEDETGAGISGKNIVTEYEAICLHSINQGRKLCLWDAYL